MLPFQSPPPKQTNKPAEPKLLYFPSPPQLSLLCPLLSGHLLPRLPLSCRKQCPGPNLAESLGKAAQAESSESHSPLDPRRSVIPTPQRISAPAARAPREAPPTRCDCNQLSQGRQLSPRLLPFSPWPPPLSSASGGRDHQSLTAPPRVSLESESVGVARDVGAGNPPPKDSDIGAAGAAGSPGSWQTLWGSSVSRSEGRGWRWDSRAPRAPLLPPPASWGVWAFLSAAGPSPRWGFPAGLGTPPLRSSTELQPARQHPRQPRPGAVTTLKEYFVKGANKQKVINVKSLSPESCAVERQNSSAGMRFLNRKRERTPHPFHEDLLEPKSPVIYNG